VAIVGLAGGGEAELARVFDEGVNVATRSGKSNKTSTRLVIFLKKMLLGKVLSGKRSKNVIRPSNFL
jgi:hypothetical protein